MKTRPMLFSAPMVRALLDGSKTQTRRVMKNQPNEDWVPESYVELHGYNKFEELDPNKVIGWGPVDYTGENGYKCQHGQPGSQLWVREAWRTVAEANSTPPRELTSAHRIWYEADQPQQPGAGKLRPSMFMPRWASRLTLEITDIRVERLQDISEADAIAEGVQCSALEKIQARHGEWAKRAYRLLWEQINGAGSWSDNPWVWVYTVKKVAR
jgi:hypothetical protein